MRRGDEKRQAILDVAERLFYLKGYEQTSVQDVLDVLKTSKGSFYHHFETKRALLETLCSQRAEKALDAAQEEMGRTADSLMRLNILLHYAFPLRLHEERFMGLLLPLVEGENGWTLMDQYARALEETFSPKIQAELMRLKDEGKVYLYYPDLTEPMLLALLNRCWQTALRRLMNMYHQGGAADPGELGEVIGAFRLAMERCLDAPFGSLELVLVPELTQAAQQVLTQMRLEQ